MASISDPVILYVEDDRFSRKVIEILFMSVLNLPKLTLFENSENFMERLHKLETKPNLIFLDIQMKPHTGYEVLNMLRAEADFQQVTTIALTANVMAHDIDQLKQAGFDGLIGKPIMDDVFPELVNRILTGEAVWYIP